MAKRNVCFFVSVIQFMAYVSEIYSLASRTTMRTHHIEEDIADRLLELPGVESPTQLLQEYLMVAENRRDLKCARAFTFDNFIFDRSATRCTLERRRREKHSRELVSETQDANRLIPRDARRVEFNRWTDASSRLPSFILAAFFYEIIFIGHARETPRREKKSAM